MGRFELPTLAGHGSEPCAYAVPPHALLSSVKTDQLCPELESNQHQRLRSPLHCPLCYRGNLYPIVHRDYYQTCFIAKGRRSDTPRRILRLLGGALHEDGMNGVKRGTIECWRGACRVRTNDASRATVSNAHAFHTTILTNASMKSVNSTSQSRMGSRCLAERKRLKRELMGLEIFMGSE